MIQTKYIIDKNSKTIKNKKYNNKILGPVPSLEDYVPPDWWQRIFNSLYLKTDADVVEDTKLTCREVDKFSDLLQLKPENIILDLCCGQGRHAIELTKRGFKVEGFDRSRYLIQRARSSAKKENINIRFKEGDARKLIYPADTFNDPRKELHVPALLEILDMPYTGSSSQCLAFCYDKSLVRGIAKEMGIPVPKAFFIEPDETTFNLPFSFPVLVKPNFGDSSFGITQKSVAENLEQLVDAISEIREKLGYDKPILVEEFLTGKDLSVGIIGNPHTSYTVLPITEEDYSDLPENLPRVCGYEAKWLPDSPYSSIRSVPANLAEETEKILVECCMKLFERLECRDYSRFDWRLNAEGNPKLLEVNPNPGWCWDGHLAKMAKYADISYGNMLLMILQASEQRVEAQQR